MNYGGVLSARAEMLFIIKYKEFYHIWKEKKEGKLNNMKTRNSKFMEMDKTFRRLEKLIFNFRLFSKWC